MKPTNINQGEPTPTEPKQTMTRARFLARCATLSAAAALQVGCPASQVRPEPGACPREAVEAMEEQLGLDMRFPVVFSVAIDKNQVTDWKSRNPLPVVFGVYREGPVTGLVVRGTEKLVVGTELQGRLWLTDRYVIARYTEAKLPDNTRVPVCITLADPDAQPGFVKQAGSKPDAAVAGREGIASAVTRWPDVSAYRD